MSTMHVIAKLSDAGIATIRSTHASRFEARLAAMRIDEAEHMSVLPVSESFGSLWPIIGESYSVIDGHVTAHD